MLTRISKEEVSLVLVEVHIGVFRNNVGERALANKLLRVGYYWPEMLTQSFIRKSVANQRSTLEVKERSNGSEMIKKDLMVVKERSSVRG